MEGEQADGANGVAEPSQSVFKQIHERDVRPWLDLIDELRAHGISQDVPLPQIAVMGDQSCGKSSVLEAISGIPFPRGSGLVTRCATQLVMKSAPPGSPWMASASIPAGAVRGKGKGEEQKVSSPEALTKVIAGLQDTLTGGDKGAFSTKTISVQVQAPGLPDLTLIDLPGIVRTATRGQRASVMAEVNDLIQRYLEQERTIILAVVPANQDVATVDILERAKGVDPEGDRTIGVLTKPDLVGPGNEDEAAAVVKNLRKPLKLGYVMVKCRSQKDIDQGMDNQEALREEASFFRKQPVFKGLPSSMFGVPNLTKRLTDLLVGRIKAALPSIKWEIQTQVVQTDKLLKPMVKGVPHTAAECHTSLMKIVSDYCRLLRQSARGYYRDDILSSKPSLRLHAASQAIFKQLHQNIAATVPGFNDSGFGERLGKEMAALRGREMPGFLNHQVFYGFMIKNVESWRPAVEACRTQAANATLTVASLLVETLAVQFPRLCVAVRDSLAGLVEQLAEEVSERIDAIFQKESDPFTTNESMLEVINAIRFRHFDKAVQDALDEAGEQPENMDALKATVLGRLGEWYMVNHGVGTMANVEDMCTLLQAYWNVATKRLVDNVCMTLEQDFVVKLLKGVESELFLLTNRHKDVEDLFLEDTSVVEKRRSLQAKKGRLLKGLESLMHMAPDLVAERPKGSGWNEDVSDDVEAETLRSEHRSLEPRQDPAGMKARQVEEHLISQAEERAASTDWSRTTWSRPDPSASSLRAATVARDNRTPYARQPDHYNMPVRTQGAGAGQGQGQEQAPQPAVVEDREESQGQGQGAHAARKGDDQEVLIQRVTDLGFSSAQAEEALKQTRWNPDEAAELLMTQGAGGNGDDSVAAQQNRRDQKRGNPAPTRGSKGGNGRSSPPVSQDVPQGQRPSPPVPSRPVKGLPADFSRQSAHPAAVPSGSSRSTHFFGSSGGAGGRDSAENGSTNGVRESKASQPTWDSTTGQPDDDLTDFLGGGGGRGRGQGSSSQQGWKEVDVGRGGTGSLRVGGPGVGAAGTAGGGGGDPYGLFSQSSQSGGRRSRVEESRSRYEALFGEDQQTTGSTVGRSGWRNNNTSSLFDDN